MLFMIAGVAFAILGFIAYKIMKMPDSPMRRKKKREPPPEPPKDWQGIAERLEKRLTGMEAKLSEAEKAIRQQDKVISGKQAEIDELKQQFQQEQTWRKKEEDAVLKEKKHEKLMEDELAKARDGLNSESTQRIKLEYELKELRTLKESAVADARRLSAHNLELERKVKVLSQENRDFKRENEELKIKKEADQWVAKDDYIRVEKMLKRSRWEVDLFKRKFAADLWPHELQMRPTRAPKDEPDYGSAPSAPPVPPPAAPVAKPTTQHLSPATLAQPQATPHPIKPTISVPVVPAVPVESSSAVPTEKAVNGQPISLGEDKPIEPSSPGM